MSSTSEMVAFDTNILLYASDTRDPRKRAVAIDTLRASQEAVLLWQVACEFIAASRKLVRYGLTTEEAWDQFS